MGKDNRSFGFCERFEIKWQPPARALRGQAVRAARSCTWPGQFRQIFTSLDNWPASGSCMKENLVRGFCVFAGTVPEGA
jgi:hypothetical protein